MVKNNGMPIEVNKKPFETVYELKNEIPSFEEFMKSYESDANLNYDDLSSGDIGEVKGYGPCGRCDCDCRYGEKFIDLYTACPAVDCGNPAVSHWVHSTDGNYLEISNKARVRCSKRYCEKDHMKNWFFKCSWHKGEKQYRRVDYDSFTRALNLSFKIQGNKEVAKSLMNHLIDNESEWN